MAPVTPAFSDLFFIYASPAFIVTSQSVLFEHLTGHVVIPTGPDIRISSGSLLIWDFKRLKPETGLNF